MSRIMSSPDEENKPSIEHSEVEFFFNQRAQRINELGPLVTVIYQDKHPELAQQRDIAEKEKLTPLLNLNKQQRVLDIGCGTGRWTTTIATQAQYYHGMDFNKGLIDYDKKHFTHLSNVKFTQGSICDLSLDLLGESQPFDLVLCVGILIYLNDDEVRMALENFAKVTAVNSGIVMREPMGVEKRLTIKSHYSDDMEQTYNAVYRTMDELQSMIREILLPKGFKIIESGNMYEEDNLNNRKETRQKWMMLERRAEEDSSKR